MSDLYDFAEFFKGILAVTRVPLGQHLNGSIDGGGGGCRGGSGGCR